MQVNEVRKHKSLGEEHARLNKPLTDPLLVQPALQKALEKR